jgi:hypothetical protein
MPSARRIHDPDEKRAILAYVEGMLQATNQPPLTQGGLEHVLTIVSDHEDLGVVYYLVTCPCDAEVTIWLYDPDGG